MEGCCLTARGLQGGAGQLGGEKTTKPAPALYVLPSGRVPKRIRAGTLCWVRSSWSLQKDSRGGVEKRTSEQNTNTLRGQVPNEDDGDLA